jgi:hypothetical protein
VHGALVSVTAKLNPVAELASPEVGDQSTDTLLGSPALPEVIDDFVRTIMQEVFVGFTLKVGREAAVLV